MLLFAIGSIFVLESSSNPLIRVKNEEFTPKAKCESRRFVELFGILLEILVNKSSPLAQFSIDYEEIDDNDDEEQTERQPQQKNNQPKKPK